MMRYGALELDNILQAGEKASLSTQSQPPLQLSSGSNFRLHIQVHCNLAAILDCTSYTLPLGSHFRLCIQVLRHLAVISKPYIQASCQINRSLVAHCNFGYRFYVLSLDLMVSDYFHIHQHCQNLFRLLSVWYRSIHL